MKRYLFVIKDNVIVPININESDVGEIILSLLKEFYFLSPIQINALSSKEAMHKFLTMKNNLDLNEIKESMLC